MASVLSLLLPALIPSWRFFKSVEPSPRVEVCLQSSGQATEIWQEFRPRPETLSIVQILRRLFWNPQWNEALYLVTLSERLIREEDPRHAAEIARRVALDVQKSHTNRPIPACFKYRISFVSRFDETISKDVLFTSGIYAVDVFTR